MGSDLIQDCFHESNPRLPRPMLRAIFIGLGLGSLFAIAWPGATGLASLARWPAGFAIGLLVVALTGRRHLGPARWDLMLGSQLLGLLAVGLFFFASLAR